MYHIVVLLLGLISSLDLAQAPFSLSLSERRLQHLLHLGLAFLGTVGNTLGLFL